MVESKSSPVPGPFRIGATSFVYPGDWCFNVERLAGRVGDSELFFFEAEGMPDVANGDRQELSRHRKPEPESIAAERVTARSVSK